MMRNQLDFALFRLVRQRAMRIMARGALAASALAALAVSVGADVPRYTVQVFTDRTQPLRSVTVTDFRINEELDERGVHRFMLRTPDGTFEVSFEHLAEVQLTRYLGLVSGDVARYDARVTFRDGAIRTGRIELRVLRGFADGMPWHLLPSVRDERGAGLFKFVFIN